MPRKGLLESLHKDARPHLGSDPLASQPHKLGLPLSRRHRVLAPLLASPCPCPCACAARAGIEPLLEGAPQGELELSASTGLSEHGSRKRGQVLTKYNRSGVG